MNIVIIGAGTVGLYIASILSQEKHNIVLVDRDGKRLEQASWQLDIATRQGSGTDWQLLDDLRDFEPKVLLALTDNDETNLVTCSIAKRLGYPLTIARLRNQSYLNRTRLDFGRIFDVDHFVAPEVLVAHDILKYILLPGSRAIESFAHGAVQLRTLPVPSHWQRSDEPLSKLDLPEGVMIGLLRRSTQDMTTGKAHQTVIIPHGNDVIQPGDEITVIGETDVVAKIPQFFGIEEKRINTVVIAGGSLTGVTLAQLLTRYGISTRLIEKNYDLCCRIAELLPHTSVLNHDPTDLEFLASEKIERTELFVGASESDEVNVLTAMLAKELGCGNCIASLSSVSYVPLAHKFQISYVASPRVSAANRILSLILSQRITSVVSLYENQIEIIEIQVSTHSPIVGIPLMELGPLLPKDFLIAMIQNRGRIMIANGNRIISPGDTVIAITTPRHVQELEEIF